MVISGLKSKRGFIQTAPARIESGLFVSCISLNFSYKSTQKSVYILVQDESRSF